VALPEETIAGLLKGQRWCLNADEQSIAAFEARTRKVFFSAVSRPAAEPDIRAVWEPARLQHVAALLHHARTTEPDRKRALHDAARLAVLTWLAENPFLFGPHYVSVMECALRIPVFFYCLKFLDNLEGADWTRIAEAIYRHAWWTEKRLSLHSSRGNHTVAEGVGLIFAGAVFLPSRDGRRWLEKGCRLLWQELGHQVLADGGPAEQSLDYHRFVLDLYWLAVDFLERNGLFDCIEFKSRLQAGEAFLQAFQDKTGRRPSIGDSDSGHAVAPGISPARAAPHPGESAIRTFAESGYTVIRTGNEVVLTFDHGPLGMPPFHNHGHADALSITLAKGGTPLLVDPGTYRYNGVPDWRAYFKGTRAHNTVTIDGLDQAVQETGFIWSRPFRTELVRNAPSAEGHGLTASHDGYCRLKRPVRHQRTILFFDGINFLVKDTFSGPGEHNFELNYHLHPDARAEQGTAWWQITNGNDSVFLLSLSGDFVCGKGERNPLFGWYSPAYGVKVESSVLRIEKRGLPGEITFVTVICTDRMVNMKRLEVLLCAL
jgi:hypothetical protein